MLNRSRLDRSGELLRRIRVISAYVKPDKQCVVTTLMIRSFGHTSRHVGWDQTGVSMITEHRTYSFRAFDEVDEHEMWQQIN